MRSFVAVEVDSSVKDALLRIIDRLRRVPADVRWVARENMHLTLKFLGEIDEAQAARLRELLRVETSRFAPLELEFVGLGRFPPQGAPRVVWAGCRGDVDKLKGLAAAVERTAKETGVPPEERPFSAHLTIGRVKSPRSGRALADAIAGFADDPFGKQTVRSFTLYKSTLTPDGPIYEAVERFELRQERRATGDE